MLRVYHSNRLDVLEALMEFIVERERLDDPFEPEMILVQSTGMAQWLQMTLSQKFGIAANIAFPLPASFIWEMFVRVLPDIPKESAFSKQSMSWKLMTLLPQLLDKDEFVLLRHYLTDDTDKRKLFQLSARAADLFDQYLVYRPDWLTQWEAGKTVEGLGEAQNWQAPLWKALVEYTAALGQPRWHRANLYQRFIQTLESATACPPGLPSRVFICGISALPPVYLRALQALGKHIEIHLLLLIRVGITGGILKTQPGWQNSWLASVVTVLKTVIYRCSVKTRIRKPYLTATVNRISVIRYWPHGENWGGIISTCYLNWKTARSWMRLLILRQIIFCIGFRRISLNWKAMRWRA